MLCQAEQELYVNIQRLRTVCVKTRRFLSFYFNFIQPHTQLWVSPRPDGLSKLCICQQHFDEVGKYRSAEARQQAILSNGDVETSRWGVRRDQDFYLSSLIQDRLVKRRGGSALWHGCSSDTSPGE